MDLSSGKCWFKKIGSIHGPLGGAGANNYVNLVNKGDYIPGSGNFIQYSLESLLKFPPVLRPCYQLTHIQSENSSVLQIIRDVTLNNPLGQPFHNSGFPDPRFTYNYGIVFQAATQNLYGLSNLFIPPDNRV